MADASSAKDFVEHLRAIHFSLVVVSVGLLVLLLAAKPYDPRAAAGELAQVLKLQRVGTPALWRDMQGQRESVNPQFDPKNLDISFQVRAPEYISSKYPALRLIGTFQTGRKQVEALLVFPVDDWTQTSGPDHAAGDPSVFPDTIDDFENWWNNLQFPEWHYLKLDFPTAVLGTHFFRVSRTSVAICFAGQRMSMN